MRWKTDNQALPLTIWVAGRDTSRQPLWRHNALMQTFCVVRGGNPRAQAIWTSSLILTPLQDARSIKVYRQHRNPNTVNSILSALVDEIFFTTNRNFIKFLIFPLPNVCCFSTRPTPALGRCFLESIQSPFLQRLPIRHSLHLGHIRYDFYFSTWDYVANYKI